MKKTRIAVAVVGVLAVLSAVALSAMEQQAVAGDPSMENRVRVLRTAPATGGTSAEEMERNYRSCLFSFLPHVGSDAAAEMIRDACRDEYPR